MYSWTKLKLDDIAKSIFNILLFFKKRELFSKYDKSILDLTEKIELVRTTTLHCKNNRWDDIYNIWNIAGFILMTSLDIKIINKRLLAEKGFGEGEFIMKSACILIFETLEDIEQILGKNFYNSLNKLSISKSIMLDLNIKKKELSQLKLEHQNDLKKVRTTIGAHRDHDFLTQLESFNGLEKTSVMNLINAFEVKINALSEPLQKIIDESIYNFFNKNNK